MNDTVQRDIGRHDQAIETLQEEVSAMRRDVAEMKAMMSEARGGWRTLLAVGAAAGAIGAFVVKAFSALKGGG